MLAVLLSIVGCERQEPIQYEVNISHLNVRSDPTMKSYVRHIAVQGDIVILVGKHNSWVNGYIVGSNIKGWLHQNYLKEID